MMSCYIYLTILKYFIVLYYRLRGNKMQFRSKENKKLHSTALHNIKILLQSDAARNLNFLIMILDMQVEHHLKRNGTKPIVELILMSRLSGKLTMAAISLQETLI
jgi:hypothetical protein